MKEENNEKEVSLIEKLKKLVHLCHIRGSKQVLNQKIETELTYA